MADTFLHGVEVLEVDSGARSITTAATSIIGIVGTAPTANAEAFPIDTPVLIAGSRVEAAKLGEIGSGTLPGALDGILDQTGAVVIVVRVEAGTTEAETLANIIGGTNAITGQYEGLYALLGAESVVGFSPRILCAPGWTHQKPISGETAVANPVVAEAIGIAEQLRAVVIADGPNTTDATAISAAGDFGSARVYMVDPWVKVFDPDGEVVDEPASARVAGVIARVDNELGWWRSPSNQLINGIVGTSRPVAFQQGNPSSRANLLNAENVATIINQDGYRLWGNRTLSGDQKWAFLCVRRTADILNASVQASMLWAVDRGINKTFLEDVSNSVNAYIRTLITKGALLGGVCWPDPDLNTASEISAGRVYFNFDFTASYPAEHITFKSILTTDYIEEALA